MYNSEWFVASEILKEASDRIDAIWGSTPCAATKFLFIEMMICFEGGSKGEDIGV